MSNATVSPAGSPSTTPVPLSFPSLSTAVLYLLACLLGSVETYPSENCCHQTRALTLPAFNSRALGGLPRPKPISAQQYPGLRDWLRGGHVTEAGPILESLRTATEAARTAGWYLYLKLELGR